MKRLFILFLFTSFTSLIFSQAIQKGNIDVHAGVGFGVYSLKSNDYKDNTSGAVPGLINVGAAYCISNAFFLGLDFERNGFITNADSNDKASSINFGVTAGMNFLNKEKNVLRAFIHLGSSNFTYNDMDNGNSVNAKGTQVQFGAGWRHYFSDKVGMFINFSIPYYSYNEFKNADGDVYKVYNPTNPFAEPRTFQVTMTGFNLRLGLALKFGG